MNKKQEKGKKKSQKLMGKRNHRISFMLNDIELNAIERHLKKYKITNKSNWFRQTILTEIWQRMDEDYPMLFKKNEMR